MYQDAFGCLEAETRRWHLVLVFFSISIVSSISISISISISTSISSSISISISISSSIVISVTLPKSGVARGQHRCTQVNP